MGAALAIEKAKSDASKFRDELLSKGFGGEAFKQLGLSPFNILVLGEVGSGKSSAINTFISALDNVIEGRDEYYGPALSVKVENSSTAKLCKGYVLHAKSDVVFYDTQGLYKRQQSMDESLFKVLDGWTDLTADARRRGPRHSQTADAESSESQSAVNKKTKIHLVAFCVSATHSWAQLQARPFDYAMLTNMIDVMREIEQSRGICSVILLTHTDTLSSRVLECKRPEELWNLPEVQQRVSTIVTVTGISSQAILPMISTHSDPKTLPIVTFNALKVLKTLSKITENYTTQKIPFLTCTGSLQVKSEMSTQCPSYWSRYKGNPLDHGKSYQLVDVSASVKQTVSSVMQATWEKAHVGIGRDAVGLFHRSFDVVTVQRLENPRLFYQYAARCDLLRKGKLNRPNPPIMTTRETSLSSHLSSEANEFYLWHGTKADSVPAICQNGFDFRVSGQGMFGSGVYFAEKSSKSDEYADYRGNRSRDKKMMFLSRVCLGNFFTAAQATSFRRPPCIARNCSNLTCLHQRHDSVVGDLPYGRLKAREFIVYEQTLCYPEYLVTYARK